MAAVTPELLLRAYAAGVFPMAETRDDPRLFWVEPERRGVLPLDRVHVPRRLRRTVLTERFRVSHDTAFELVLQACAETRPERPETWINLPIERLYGELHRMGHAHSIEAWLGNDLAGGLYGVSLGGAFFGESMFSRARDASKVALVHLAGRLRLAGYTLLDTQFVTAHLARFGAREVPRAEYHRLLTAAIGRQADFYLGGSEPSVPELLGILQSSTQTS